MTRNYAYYPGCSALKSAVELDRATRLVASQLGIRWTVLDDAACCGSRECGGLEVQDEHFALALNARTLAMAEAAGVDTIVNVCSTCQLKLATDNLRLQSDSPLRQKVNSALAKIGLKYDGGVQITHLLYVLLEDIGLEAIRALVKRPLDGLRVAPFYGCHLLRPAQVHGYREDPYQPRSLAVLIEALGGVPVHYSGETQCCGFHSLVIQQKPALRLSANHLGDAKRLGAEVMVTPCPLCFTVLDGYQFRAEVEAGEKLNLPILHLPQLVGFALGLLPEELGLQRHLVDPRRALAAHIKV